MDDNILSSAHLCKVRCQVALQQQQRNAKNQLTRRQQATLVAMQTACHKYSSTADTLVTQMTGRHVSRRQPPASRAQFQNYFSDDDHLICRSDVRIRQRAGQAAQRASSSLTKYDEGEWNQDRTRAKESAAVNRCHHCPRWAVLTSFSQITLRKLKSCLQPHVVAIYLLRVLHSSLS